MKKITLLVAVVLLVVNVAKASAIIKITDQNTLTRYSLSEPICFTERGIEFFVFPNGDFDFNTRANDSQGDYHYKLAGKRLTTTQRNEPINYGVLIEHDSFGRVRRVGNTFINYDNRDRVNRIGTVYMNYNRYALVQVGGLQIVYNRRGEIVDLIGQVKGYRNYGFTHNYYQTFNGYYNHNNCDNNYDTDYDTDDHALNNDSNAYYYYKTDGTRSKIDDVKNEDKK